MKKRDIIRLVNEVVQGKKILTETDSKFSPLTINFGEIEMGTQWEDLSDEEKIKNEKYKSQYGGYTIQHTIKWEDVEIMINTLKSNVQKDSQNRWEWIEGPILQEAIETLWNKVESGESDVWN